MITRSYKGQGQILGEGAGGVHPPEMTCGFLIQLVFCIKICLGHQLVTPVLSGAPPPKKNPGSAPEGLQRVTRGCRGLPRLTGGNKG